MLSPILTAEQKKSYQQNGFLILKDFISIANCKALIQRAHDLISDFDDQGVRAIFSTLSKKHERNKYFLESGNDIRFFFEENAFDAKGHLQKTKHLSINKIGHALHNLDPIFNSFSRSEQLKQLAKDLEIHDPRLVQSMYICKQPYIGGEVTCHQDSTFLYAEPQPVTGLWFALEDATLENGCLWAIPGGHQIKLKERLILDKTSTTKIKYDNTPWPLEHMQALPVPRGSLIVLHGLLPHMSKENKSQHSRHAYTLHLMSSQDHYAEDNWLHPGKESSFARM